MTEGDGSGRVGDAGRLVGVAIQNLAAERLGRGFLPLAVLFLAGVVTMFTGDPTGRGLVLALGAPVAAGALLAQGLRIAQQTMGRPHRAWMSLAALGSVLPPTLGIWVLGWLGLRAVAAWEGPGPVVVGLVWTWLGAWVLRSWLRIVELDRLARTMDPASLDEGVDGTGTPGP